MKDSASELDVLGVGREPGEHGYDVGSVSLRNPDRVVSETVGFLDQLELVLRSGAGTPVAGAERELQPYSSTGA